MSKLDIYKDKFNKNGFVLLKDYLSNEEAHNIVEIANELEQWKEMKGKWMLFFEKKCDIKYKSRIENFINYHEGLNKFLKNKIENIVEEIYNGKLNLLKDKLNWKFGGGKGFKAHQDQPAWTDFEPERYVTVALFANNTTKENGCLEFSYDSYKEELLSYDKNTTGQLTKEIEDNINWKHIETTPRDILIFDSYAPHRSGPNNTKNNRRIFYFTYNEDKYGDLYDSYLKKKREEFPPDIERDNKKINILNNKYNLANPIV